MVLRQKLKRLSVLLTISDPMELEDSQGVFKTTLTHPKLEGELYFVHGREVGRDQILKALDENIIGHLKDLVDAAGELINGKKASSTPASDPARR